MLQSIAQINAKVTISTPVILKNGNRVLLEVIEEYMQRISLAISKDTFLKNITLVALFVAGERLIRTPIRFRLKSIILMATQKTTWKKTLD